MFSIQGVEVKLALLIQSLQPDQIVPVQLGILQSQHLNVLAWLVEHEVSRLLGDDNLVLVEHHHHKVLQLLHPVPVDLIDPVPLVVDGGEVGGAGLVAGEVERVVPVLCRGQEVLMMMMIMMMMMM